MKPIIIRSNLITKLFSVFIDVGAITLYPFIILREDFDNEVTINHESIHIRQQEELWVALFYILYVWYWLVAKSQGKSNFDAYMAIPFEQEAYTKQYEFDYLDNRDRHSWRLFTSRD